LGGDSGVLMTFFTPEVKCEQLYTHYIYI